MQTVSLGDNDHHTTAAQQVQHKSSPALVLMLEQKSR